MGAKSNKIKFTQAETFLRCLEIRRSVGTSGMMTMLDHGIMFHNDKGWFKTKSRQNQAAALVTSGHETVLPTVSDQETGSCCAFSRAEFGC